KKPRSGIVRIKILNFLNALMVNNSLRYKPRIGKTFIYKTYNLKLSHVMAAPFIGGLVNEFNSLVVVQI
ncbi:MAG TPA: hypothetical protein PLF48_00650, partial [Chitinophagales bacterium]|nr:hypothetical protein [Chitinophagales bacterium]